MTHLELFQKALCRPFIDPALMQKVKRQKWFSVILHSTTDKYGTFKKLLDLHDIAPLDNID